MNEEVRKAASILGSLNLGKKKTITQEDRTNRINRLAEARKKRWLKKDEDKEVLEVIKSNLTVLKVK